MCKSTVLSTKSGCWKSAGTSTVWDDQFETDEAAKAGFNLCIAEEGIISLTPVRNFIND